MLFLFMSKWILIIEANLDANWNLTPFYEQNILSQVDQYIKGLCFNFIGLENICKYYIPSVLIVLSYSVFWYVPKLCHLLNIVKKIYL